MGPSGQKSFCEGPCVENPNGETELRPCVNKLETKSDVIEESMVLRKILFSFFFGAQICLHIARGFVEFDD